MRYKKSRAHFFEKSVEIYEFIEVERICYPVKLLCRVMRVSRPAYYAWRKKRESGETNQAAHAAQVKECFDGHRRRYGSRRVAAELKSRGHCNRKIQSAPSDERTVFDGDHAEKI